MRNINKTPMKSPTNKFTKSASRPYFIFALVFICIAIFMIAIIKSEATNELDMKAVLILDLSFIIPSIIFLLIGLIFSGPANPIKKNIRNLETVEKEDIDKDVNENGPIFSRSYINSSVRMGDEYLLYRSPGGRRGGQACGVIRLSDIVWMYTTKSNTGVAVAMFGILGMLFSKGTAILVYVASEKFAHQIVLRNEKDADEVLNYLRESAPSAMIGMDRDLAKKWRKDKESVLDMWQERSSHQRTSKNDF